MSTTGFKMVVDGTDVTATIGARLLELTIIDEPGKRADSLELKLDDKAPHIQWPPTSAAIDISLGYDGAFLPMGQYVADEVELDGPPDTLSIRARGGNLSAASTRAGATTGLKQQRSRSWHQTTIGAVLIDLAGDLGIGYSIAPEVTSIAVGHLDQIQESAGNLIGRLAKDYDLHIAVKGGLLVAVDSQSPTSAGGLKLPVVSIPRPNILTFRGARKERRAYARVTVGWNDTENGVSRSTTVGAATGSQYIHRHPYPDQATAERAAKAMLRRSGRSKGELELTIIGDARILAKTHITVSGLRAELDGRWVVRRCDHRLDGSGLQTSLTAEPAD